MTERKRIRIGRVRSKAPRCSSHRRLLPCGLCLLPLPASVPYRRSVAPTTTVIRMRWIRVGWDRLPILASVVIPPSAWSIIEHWRPSFFISKDDA